ncbi:hypothetical protein [Paenibacillus elgii]|uniref:hypothetical protein n=1 Tax=Paenibacillus elgii TaxID=189691 RepID=UPI00203A79C3|nr:hypothetical protein [Paenibacillus elgii]
MIRFVGIDPATKTGFVALDEQGNVLIATELTGKSKEDIEKLVELENEVYRHLKNEDEIVIEGTPFDTQKAITAGMIHGGVRTMVVRKGLRFNQAAPNSVKKYVGVTGWVGEPGSKRRLKDKEKKEAMKEAVQQHFDFTHKSHNVIDAYVIARIAWNLYRERELLGMIDRMPYQLEVVRDILNPKK